jgi:putative ABC transport system permease protein
VKYFPLVWAGLWRKPVRTILTTLAIVANFTLFGLLQAVNFGFADIIANQRLDRLLTDPRATGGVPMPIAAQRLIEQLPGVSRVAKRAGFWGYFREQKDWVNGLATDPADWFAVRPEYKVSHEELEALLHTRDGILLTSANMKYFGWKVGDRIPLYSEIERIDGNPVWTFTIVGVFDQPERAGEDYLGLINYDFFDEMRVADRGTADRFIVRIEDPNRATQTAAAIDALFANSPHETYTQNEREFAQAQLKQEGDIAFFTNAIVAAVFFALLLVTANSMAQSVRERTGEFAVLKTIGFSDGGVLMIVLTEAAILCLVAALVGVGIAAALFPWVGDKAGMGNGLHMSKELIAAALAAAVMVALLSSLVPAWQARRLSIVDALAEAN